MFVYDNPSVRKFCLSVVQIFSGKKNIVKDSAFFNRQIEEKAIRQLKDNGYYVFGNVVSDHTVQEIKESLENKKLELPWLKDCPKVLISEVPEGVHFAKYDRSDLVLNSKIMNIANDPGVLRVVQEHLGARPTIIDVLSWWSFPSKVPLEAENFHRDYDGLKFLKLFVYLTDVEKQNGPHTYVEGSHVATQYFKGASAFYRGRFEDEAVQKVFSADKIKQITGTKGNMFIADTSGVHKGQHVSEGKRLVMVVVYGLHRILYENYEPVKTKTESYDPQINRLILSPASK